MENDKLLNEYRDRVNELSSFVLPNAFVSDKIKGGLDSMLNGLFSRLRTANVFAVSGIPLDRLPLKETFDGLVARFTYFTGFSPNPKIGEIERGVELFDKTGADLMIAVGGGSAIDTAKCIRYFGGKKIPLAAIPTTAGTGSEATRFAVYYRDGVKQSLDDISLLPDFVFLCGETTDTLPDYQRKCTFLDAFCQACESAFGKRRSGESLKIAFGVIKAMSFVKDFYPAGKKLALSDETLMPEGIPSLNTYALLCSYCSGRAIDYTRTAAPHAMSYRLSSLKNIPHGHAVALCFGPCFEKTAEVYLNNEGGDGEVCDIISRISDIAFGVPPRDFYAEFKKYVSSLGLSSEPLTESEAKELASSVNVQRLLNNPVVFTEDELAGLYLKIGR